MKNTYISANESYYGLQEPSEELNTKCICNRELEAVFSVQYIFAGTALGCNGCIGEKVPQNKSGKKLCKNCDTLSEIIYFKRKTGEEIGCENCLKLRSECFFN